MNLLMYMAPVAVAFLLPASIIMEEDVLGITIQLAREDSTIVWLLLFNSALAYFVNLTNFLVTKHTSALTLQVIIVSLLLFHIRFNLFDISSVLIKRTADSKLL
ncbi:putative sugar phosphate/phosphate translocator [Trifolium repens]|nr:putative sugar phosphate/phosphate translocator [Trifolium repens]